MNLPSWISLSRILMAAFLSAAVLNGHFLWLIPGLLLASLTDILDGYVARKLNIACERGRHLDRLCDQVLEFFLGLSFFAVGALPQWYFFVLAIRCFLQLGTSPFFFKSMVRAELVRLYRRDKVGSAMTLVVFFFLGLAYGLREEAPPLSEGLLEVALPYVLLPLSGVLEVLNIYLQGSRIARLFENTNKQKEGNNN